MKQKNLIPGLVLLLSIIACNLPSGNPPATQTPIVQIITATPADTPVPTFTLIPTCASEKESMPWPPESRRKWDDPKP